MNSSSVQEAPAMGRVTVEVKLANNREVQAAELRTFPAEQVRRTLLEGTVDPGANWLVLPTAVADQLGLPITGKITVTYANRSSAVRDMCDQVEIEVLGRKTTVQAVLEPARKTALIGAIVLEALDLLVDCRHQRVIPRDPSILTCEVE
jgi:predicted aspartyl protease